ncbi:hypothetical protein AFCDBAGC_1048 [Methylobacterium cerastii]|uniref:Uncharacterized protein n=1 Tax=Methylobacterium cerastii TaxID=932741 RepID=A0ABQ4QDB8_9HYPH|nr:MULTISPECIES: hypothetical protein [Methylobacterium]TXN41719.1 hypothetical protein FV225_01625 [Methylobacterium sp. WL93]TXN51044.1 hypothetical protein FV227_09530 [Methylobacterium sp. WL119]TXN65828.1 hypothetical protein FV232_17200 [Methylobacterium sp. WL30]TXN75104.1 hypothetical protein FV228_04400 [Methylobacterium sp. WL18]GJD43201.1 hypothetical protein AFCDBAGC_1048 [Methylobacterium cerastii]
MMLANIIEGLGILAKHFTELADYKSGSDQYQFNVCATDTPLTTDEVARMDDLGWFQPDAEEDEAYDPSQGWSFFT